MFLWGKSEDARCTRCQETETLMHTVAGCKVYLEEKRYTWRHDSVLNYIAKSLSALQGCQLFADLDAWMSPCTITGQDHRPDLLVVKGSKLYVLELTVDFESNIEINRDRKQRKYVELIKCLESSYEEISFVILSIGAIGIFGKSCDSFISMLNDLNTSKA